jgi:pyruvate,water dikinase
LLDYSVQGVQPGSHALVWSRLPLQALAPGVLTPFSYSVLNDLMGRAWYQYYDRLGFAPAPRPRLLRHHLGRVYLNLTVCARLEAEQAGVEPLTLTLDGQPYPLAHIAKSGFLAGFKLSRAQQKIDDTLAALGKEIDAVTAKAESWHAKTLEMRWTQADILLIMEEIERAGTPSMIALFAARHNLALTYARLIEGSRDALGYPANLAAINAALGGTQRLVESEIAAALVRLGAGACDNAAVMDWLAHADARQAPAVHPDALPDAELATALADFLARYGHRGLGEGESRCPRWAEAPQPVLASILACAQGQPRQPDLTTSAAQEKLLGAFGSRQKVGRALLQRAADLHRLQSRALDAFAWVLAGTRRWVSAAAREAMTDQRLRSQDEIFFFELEEIKQMMTGEWNVSDRDDIHATAARRQAEYAQWQQTAAPAILVGDTPGHLAHTGLPGASGQRTGPWQPLPADLGVLVPNAIYGDVALDSGHALLLSCANGFVCRDGAPYDPVVVAAQPWGCATVLGLGDGYAALTAGTATTVDGDAGLVTQ